MKTTYVVFANNNARILTRPTDETLKRYGSIRGAVILKNPTRMNLKGIPPHLWNPDVNKNEIWPKEDKQEHIGKIAIDESVITSDDAISKDIAVVADVLEPAVSVGFFKSITNWFTK